jgi:hypothetical protein
LSATDIAGLSRRSGKRLDIGCHEAANAGTVIIVQ